MQKIRSGGKRVLYTNHNPCWDAKIVLGCWMRCRLNIHPSQHVLPPGKMRPRLQMFHPCRKQLYCPALPPRPLRPSQSPQHRPPASADRREQRAAQLDALGYPCRAA